MRRASLAAILLVSGCASSAPASITMGTPVVSIAPAAPGPDRPAPVSTVADPGRDARVIAALNTNGDVQAALGPQKPDPRYPPYASLGGGLNLGSGMPRLGTGGIAGPSPPVVKGPTPQAAVGGTVLSGGRVANVDKVILALGPSFRRCFKKGLDVDPTMTGKVTLTVTVAMTGDVIAVSPSAVTGLSPEVVACVVLYTKSAPFEAPQGASSATIAIPITFTTTMP